MRQFTKGGVTEIAGLPYGDRRRVAVITAPSRPAIVERLERRTVGTLLRHGVRLDAIDVVRAPSLAELPAVAGWVVAAGRHDAIAVVGLALRSDTPDADLLVAEARRAIAAIAAGRAVPIATGLAVRANWLSAAARIWYGRRDLARDAAVAALALADLLEQVELRPPGGAPRSGLAAQARVASALGPRTRAPRPT